MKFFPTLVQDFILFHVCRGELRSSKTMERIEVQRRDAVATFLGELRSSTFRRGELRSSKTMERMDVQRRDAVATFLGDWKSPLRTVGDWKSPLRTVDERSSSLRFVTTQKKRDGAKSPVSIFSEHPQVFIIS